MKKDISRIIVLGWIVCHLFSCTKEYFNANDSVSSLIGDGKIEFSSKQEAFVKSAGSTASDLLGKQFMVWGQKIKSSSSVDVFTGDTVKYENSKWYYVNNRYWDTTDLIKYIFRAYSDSTKSLVNSSSYASFTTQSMDTNKLSKIYIAEDSVLKSNVGSVVSLKFRNMCSWVRFKFVNELKKNAKVRIANFKMQNGSASDYLYLVSNNADKFVTEATITYTYANGKPTYENATKTQELKFGDSIASTDSIPHDSYRFDKEGEAYTKVFPTSTGIPADTAKVTFIWGAKGINKTNQTAVVMIPASLMKWEMNKKYTYIVTLNETGSLNLKRIEFDDIGTGEETISKVCSIVQEDLQGGAR